MEYQFGTSGDGGGGVGNRTTQFYPHKVDFTRDIHDEDFSSSQSHHTAFSLV